MIGELGDDTRMGEAAVRVGEVSAYLMSDNGRASSKDNIWGRSFTVPILRLYPAINNQNTLAHS